MERLMINYIVTRECITLFTSILIHCSFSSRVFTFMLYMYAHTMYTVYTMYTMYNAVKHRNKKFDPRNSKTVNHCLTIDNDNEHCNLNVNWITFDQ